MTSRISLESRDGTSRLKLGCEIIVGATACLSPWAFGSVDAWAEFGLGICVAILAVFSAINVWRSGDSPRLLNAPGLAIAGLALLAWFQTVPLPPVVYKWIDPPGPARTR